MEIKEFCRSLYCETLDIKNIDGEGNFFNLGGDSVSMIKLLSDVENEYGIDIPYEDFIDNASINLLTNLIESRLNNNVCNEETNFLDCSYEIQSKNKWDPFPLSELQESYFIAGKEEEYDGVPTYAYLELECQCYEHKKFTRIINRLIERHDMLRVSIEENGTQIVHKNIENYSIPLMDLINFSEEKQKKTLLDIRKSMIREGVDYTKPPLVVIKVSRIKPNEAIIHLYADGMIMDGWSYEVFHGELETLYKDENIVLPELNVSYSDYIYYKQALKKSTKYNLDKDYWLKRIKTLPEGGVLPTIKEWYELADYRGSQIECSIAMELWTKIEEKAQKYKVTPFSVLFSSFALVIARWNNKQNFLLNIPEFDRPNFHPEVTRILGVCSAFLIFEVDNREEQTFLGIVQRNLKHLMELIAHHSFSGIEVLREIYRSRNTYKQALVPIVFGMMPDLPHIDKRMMKVRYQENHTSQIWIDINTVAYDNIVSFNWNYIKGFMEPNMIRNMVTMQKEILRKAAYEDDFWTKEFSLSLPSCEQAIIDKSNDTEKSLVFECMSKVIENRFLKFKNHIYCTIDDKTYTYGEIHKYVKALSHVIKKKGCKKGDYVTIYMDKCIEQIISVLAIIYSGAVYAPMEYGYPKDMIHRCMDKIGSKVIIISEEDRGMIEEASIQEIVPVLSEMKNGEMDKPVETDEDSLIGIIHTSGSTGIPKAVMVGQKGLLNSLIFTNEYFNVTENDACIALTNLAHDMAMYDIFGMLLAGGKIVIPKAESAKDPDYWMSIVKINQVTIWNSVPAILEMMVQASEGIDDGVWKYLRLVISGGDYLHPRLAEKIKNVNNKLMLVNVGGPTETTLWNIFHVVTDEDIRNKNIPYGKPIYNTKYYVLNEKMEQVPIGVTGTMYCAGYGVTTGYVNDLDTTEKKYTLYKPTGERIYNTGDLGKYDHNGNLFFMGREDLQVKIQGKRIELESISSILKNIEEIKNCTTCMDTNGPNIIAYYVSDNELESDYLREKLLEQLPNYMIPKYFMRIPEIPLTANGKIDKRALLDMDINEEFRTKKVEPNSFVERKVVDICSDLLERKVYLNDDFFSLGGNSILAVQCLSKIREVYPIQISLTELFERSTIGEWCNLIEKKLQVDNKIIRTVKKNKWISHGTNRIEAKINLMCFPHAGGSAMYYTPWVDYLDNRINLWPIQYPFREDRQQEKMPSTIQELAYQMAVDCKELFQKPFAFFGHCTGSVISYEVAKQVKLLYGKEPEVLFVSSNPSPCYKPLQNTEEWSDQQFIEFLDNYGFIQKDMFQEEEFASYFLPIIRGDFKIHENYNFENITLLNCPIYAYYGSDDLSILDRKMVKDWSKFTTKDFHEKVFNGGHFYLDRQKKDICKEITDILGERW
ncbi:amino acid adenylation domain-containing protein [Hathewaya histolytica]|uniref:amino acid adenylation domain-containing protein n=1 Tax=Hathewaya histolytica TaxID=1498 RepID=UPI003B6790A4